MDDMYVEFDKARRLRLTLKGAKTLSRLCDGRGLIVINQKLAEFDIDTLERVLFAAMVDDEPTLTLNLTGKRVADYFAREHSLVPLFTAAVKTIDASGLFNQPTEPEGNGTAATAT